LSKKRILFVSYFTEEYERWAQSLEMSLIRLGLDSRIVYRKSGGSWAKNICNKQEVVLESFAFARDYDYVCWIDADSLVVRKPDLLWNIECDMAFRSWDAGRLGKYEPTLGLLLVRPCRETELVIRSWSREQSENRDRSRCDQQALRIVLSKTNLLRVVCLPRTYNNLSYGWLFRNAPIIARRMVGYDSATQALMNELLCKRNKPKELYNSTDCIEADLLLKECISKGIKPTVCVPK